MQLLWLARRRLLKDNDLGLDVMEVPDDVPVLIRQLPLEQLDIVIDLRSRTLIGNPTHGGEHVFELYGLVDGPCCPVFITRGVGTVTPPMRFLCRPEVVLITLV